MFNFFMDSLLVSFITRQHHNLTPHIHTSTTVLNAAPMLHSGGLGTKQKKKGKNKDKDKRDGGSGSGGGGSKSKSGWCIDTRNNVTNVETRHQFDWLVVANGHYAIPDKRPVQQVPNLHRYPGVIMHSVEYVFFF